MKSVIAGITVWGASSISHCPARDYLTSDVGCHQLGLLDEEVAAGLFACQHQHCETGRAQLGEILRVSVQSCGNTSKPDAQARRANVRVRIDKVWFPSLTLA